MDERSFDSSRQAFFTARERASVAAAFERDTLHAAVYDARQAGLSVRQTAAALHVSKSTVARHWHGPTADEPPLWGSERAWRQAHEDIWAHDPARLADRHVPYQWDEHDGARTVRVKPRGQAVQDGSERTASED